MLERKHITRWRRAMWLGGVVGINGLTKELSGTNRSTSAWLRHRRCLHGRGHYPHGRNSDVLGDRHTGLCDGSRDWNDYSDGADGVGLSDQPMEQDQILMEIEI